MVAKSYIRGNEILASENGEDWIFLDTGELVHETHKERTCGRCGKLPTPEGHDACLGTLPGVMNACCGHGNVEEAYIQFLDGFSVGGKDAKVIQRILKKQRRDDVL